MAERSVLPKKPGNSGGGKGPQLKTDATSSAGPQREINPPGTGSLHPVTIGAAVELTKPLKPLVERVA